jgi:hypothetical protein
LCSGPSPCPARRRTWSTAGSGGLRSRRGRRGDRICCRGASMCVGGGACNRATLRRGRCANSLQGQRILEYVLQSDEPIRLGMKRKMFSCGCSDGAALFGCVATPLPLARFRTSDMAEMCVVVSSSWCASNTASSAFSCSSTPLPLLLRAACRCCAASDSSQLRRDW